MIIVEYSQASRNYSSHSRYWDYLTKKDDALILRGDITVLDRARERAAAVGHHTPFRSFVVSPSVFLDSQQMFQAVEVLAREWNFDPSDTLIVRHHKTRSDPSICPFHFHIEVPEVSADCRQIMSSDEAFYRVQRVGRFLECMFDLPNTRSPDLFKIAEDFRQAGYESYAQRIRSLFASR